MSQLSVGTVAVISRAYKALRANPTRFAGKTDADIAVAIRATATSLATLSRSGLAADVRLPATKVASMLWAIYKAAKGEARMRAELAHNAAEADADAAAAWAV